MSVYVINDESGDINNDLKVTVNHEWVGEALIPFISQRVTIPTRTNQQYHVIRLCHDNTRRAAPDTHVANNFWLDVRAQNAPAPTGCVSKIISAWGTILNFPAQTETNLFRAVQINNLVQFWSDMEHDDYGVAGTGLSTGGVWQYRGAKGAWPVGLTAAAYFRIEGARQIGDTANLGLAQVNLLGGNNVVDGTNNEGNMGFRTQGKGMARVNQIDMSHDNVRVIIPPGPKEGYVAVYIGTHSKGHFYPSGFELRPQPSINTMEQS